MRLWPGLELTALSWPLAGLRERREGREGEGREGEGREEEGRGREGRGKERR